MRLTVFAFLFLFVAATTQSDTAVRSERFELHSNHNEHHRLTLDGVSCHFDFRISGPALHEEIELSLQRDNTGRYSCFLRRVEYKHQLHFVGFALGFTLGSAQRAEIAEHNAFDSTGALLEGDDYQLDESELEIRGIPGWNGDLYRLELVCMVKSTTLRAAKIIPEIIDDATMDVAMAVAYGGTLVIDGVSLSPATCVAEPRVSVGEPPHAGETPALFTLVMTDPDPPSPEKPIFREWLHWIITNIPQGGTASDGDAVVKYAPPTPPEGTHRYVFLLFRQPQRLQLEQPPRKQFNTRTFAKEHALGDPVSAAFFYSERERRA